MKTIIKDNVTITYLDEIWFIFNPAVVEVKTNATAVVKIMIGREQNVWLYTDTRNTYNNAVKCDVSEYMRLVAEVDPTSGESGADIYFKIEVNGEEVFTFSTFAIWGVLSYGDIWNKVLRKDRKVTWYKSLLPYQLINIFYDYDDKISVRYDNDTTFETVAVGAKPIFAVRELMEEFPEAQKQISIRVGKDDVSVFDATFGETFTPLAEDTSTITIDINDCTEGALLRWVDRYGILQHYLFSVANEQYKHSDEGEELYQNYTYGTVVMTGATRPQYKTVQKQIKAGVPLADGDTLNMLLSLLQAVYVEMLVGGTFVPVRLSTGTNTVTKDNLQDFEITILMPESKSQIL